MRSEWPNLVLLRSVVLAFVALVNTSGCGVDVIALDGNHNAVTSSSGARSSATVIVVTVDEKADWNSDGNNAWDTFDPLYDSSDVNAYDSSNSSMDSDDSGE